MLPEAGTKEEVLDEKYGLDNNDLCEILFFGTFFRMVSVSRCSPMLGREEAVEPYHYMSVCAPDRIIIINVPAHIFDTIHRESCLRSIEKVYRLDTKQELKERSFWQRGAETETIPLRTATSLSLCCHDQRT